MDITVFIIPALIFLSLILALFKKVSPFELFISGAREGMNLVVEIFPSLLAMLVAVNLLKASGLIEDIGLLLKSVIPGADFIASLSPMMLFRPISGSASLSVLQSICTSFGADSLACSTASAIQGSTDTTFYVITLYFGSIGIKRWRHTIKAGLIADVIGMSMAIILAILMIS